MTTIKNQPTIACETGKTGGGLLQALAAFFRRFTPKHTAQPDAPAPADTMSPSQAWMVTWQSRRGDIQTDTVLISGAWPMERIEHQARIAMHLQHNISGAQILRLSLDFNMTPARLEALQRITLQYQNRMKFEEGCG